MAVELANVRVCGRLFKCWRCRARLSPVSPVHTSSLDNKASEADDV